MKPLQILTPAILAFAHATTLAADGNLLKTMPHGAYECAIPGDAGSPVWEPVEGAGFIISHTSGYRTENGRGTYLLKGKDLIVTSGPKKGERYRRTGDGELKRVAEDGRVTRFVCVKVASRH